MKIERIKEAGLVLRYIFQELFKKVVIGSTLLEIDSEAGRLLQEAGAKSGTRLLGFPGNLFLSINQEVMGGLPRKYILKEGDLLSLDMTLYYKGVYVDKALTIGLEPLHFTTRYLLSALNMCFTNVSKLLKNGVDTNYIGSGVELIASRLKMVPGKDFFGHGIGLNAHEPPFIPNFADKSTYILKTGDVITLEPVIFYQQYYLTYPNKYTVEASCLSAHQEDTFLITDNGAEVLT
jgi:methionyl aminopeptidase